MIPLRSPSSVSPSSGRERVVVSMSKSMPKSAHVLKSESKPSAAGRSRRRCSCCRRRPCHGECRREHRTHWRCCGHTGSLSLRERHRPPLGRPPTCLTDTHIVHGAPTCGDEGGFAGGGGTTTELLRHRCGTGTELVRIACGTGAERVRNGCGAPAERRRNDGGSAARRPLEAVNTAPAARGRRVRGRPRTSAVVSEREERDERERRGGICVEAGRGGEERTSTLKS